MRIYLYQAFLCLVVALSMPGVLKAQESVISPTPTEATPVASAESEEPLLIANVNFTGVSTSTEGSTVVAVFSLKNSFGRQDGITYGVIFRSLKTGALLGSLTASDTVALAEGEKADLHFVYQTPDYLAESAEVLLAAYNQAGLPLAFARIGTVTASQAAIACTNEGDVVNCNLTRPALAAVTVREGSPQGVVVFSQTIKMDTDSRIELPTLIRTLEPGRYIASVVLSDENTGSVVGMYATDFTKDGEYAKLMSVSPRILADGTVEVVTYAKVGRVSAGAGLSLVVSLGNCADTQTMALDAPVKTLVFATNCKDGTVMAKLLSGERVLDMTEVQFGEAATTSPDETASTPTTAQPVSSTNGSILVFVTLGGIVFLAVLLWYIANRKPTAVPPATMVLAYLALATVLAGFATTVEAATYAQTVFSGPMLIPDDNEWACTYTLNLDKASYSPGDSMLMSGDSTCNGGVNITQSNSGLNYNAPSGSPTTPLFDTPSPLVAGAPSLVAHNDPVGGTIDYSFYAPFSRVVSIPGTMTAGSHYLALRISSVVQAFGDPVASKVAYVNLNFNVTSPNTPPTSNAGADYAITLPTSSVTVSGASASDPEGPVASTVWAFVSGPVSPTITNGTTLTPTLHGMTAAGTYIFRLTVTDSAGVTTTDLMQVVVSPAPAVSVQLNFQ